MNKIRFRQTIRELYHEIESNINQQNASTELLKGTTAPYHQTMGSHVRRKTESKAFSKSRNAQYNFFNDILIFLFVYIE